MNRLVPLVIMIPCIVFGQQKKALPPTGSPTREQEKIAEINNQCLHTSKYKVRERRAFFPFNSATTIKLVSFSDTSRIYTPIAVNNFVIDYSKVIESTTLSNAGIDSLTDILYNVGLTPVKGLRFEIADPGGKCYNPRNAILFIDGQGKVTQYIEFCFECHRYYLSSIKIKNTVYCEQKYDLLKNYFLEQGIRYGTVLPKSD